jgi:hypothetical protein
MSTRQVYTNDGEVEVIDLSPRKVPAFLLMYCPDCEQVKKHTLVAVSSLYGPIYMCHFCGRSTQGGACP